MIIKTIATTKAIFAMLIHLQIVKIRKGIKVMEGYQGEKRIKMSFRLSNLENLFRIVPILNESSWPTVLTKYKVGNL